jgi:hypothetical protein
LLLRQEARAFGSWSVMMAQMGFFDLSNRYASLDAKKDPVVRSTPLCLGKSIISTERTLRLEMSKLCVYGRLHAVTGT